MRGNEMKSRVLEVRAGQDWIGHDRIGQDRIG